MSIFETFIVIFAAMTFVIALITLMIYIIDTFLKKK